MLGLDLGVLGLRLTYCEQRFWLKRLQVRNYRHPMKVCDRGSIIRLLLITILQPLLTEGSIQDTDMGLGIRDLGSEFAKSGASFERVMITAIFKCLRGI